MRSTIVMISTTTIPLSMNPINFITRNLKNTTQKYKHRVTEIQKDGKIRKNKFKNTKKSNAPTLHISVSSQFPAPPQSCEANQEREVSIKKFLIF